MANPTPSTFNPSLSYITAADGSIFQALKTVVDEPAVVDGDGNVLVPAITHQDWDEAATKTAYYAYLAAQGLSA